MKKTSAKKKTKVMDEESEGYAAFLQDLMNKHFKKIIKNNKPIKIKD